MTENRAQTEGPRPRDTQEEVSSPAGLQGDSRARPLAREGPGEGKHLGPVAALVS